MARSEVGTERSSSVAAVVFIATLVGCLGVDLDDASPQATAGAYSESEAGVDAEHPVSFPCSSYTDCIEVLGDPPCVRVFCGDDGFCRATDYECDIGDRCHVGWCDPLGGSGQGSCEMAFCQQFDGVADFELAVGAVSFDLPEDLDVGMRIDLYAYGSCDGTSVVRSSESGELLLLSTFVSWPADDPESWYARLSEYFGEDWEGLIWPLGIRFEQGVCPVVETGCGMASRGTVEVSHLDGTTQFLDGRPGWANGGYFVKPRLEYSDEYCQSTRAYKTRSAILIGRDACRDDCPTPTMESGCLPESEERPVEDFFRLRSLIPETFDNRFDYVASGFECQVVDAYVDESLDDRGPAQVRELDCVPFFQPQEHNDCGH